MQSSKFSIRYLTYAGMIAGLYAALTLVLAPFSFGVVQVRVSEALTLLAFYNPAAVPGLFVGCILANLLGGNGPIDVVFGSLATLIAALMTSKMPNKYMAAIPPIVVNGVVVGLILHYVLQFPLLPSMLSVAAGEAVACVGLGIPLVILLEKYSSVIAKKY